MSLYNQSSSNINSLYDIIEYNANVEGLTCSNKQPIKDTSFETRRLFFKFNFVESSELYLKAIDESMKVRINSNDSMMIKTVYYYWTEFL